MTNPLIENGYLKAWAVPQCEECGSSDLTVGAYVYWDEYQQQWLLDEIDYDRIWCADCDNETSMDQNPLSRKLKIHFTVRRKQEERTNGS